MESDLVDMILRELGDGMSAGEIIAEHPHLTEHDIRAAQAFATDHMANDEIIFR